jgi:hypothetical protein
MVIRDIDVMVENLRAEEKADIEHRDWCESERKSAEFKNENLQYDQEQLTQKIERAEGQKAELEEEIQKTNTEKNETLALMEDAKMTRIAENSAFQQALKDDADAVMLIGKAIQTLSRVYGFVQKRADGAGHKKAGQPEYDEDSAPETFSGDYGGRKSEGTGILSILSMIKEDIQKEMKVIADLGAVHENKAASESATNDFLADLGPNCDWVDKHFDSRAEKRKAEIEGLQKAKSVLAGAGESSLISGKHHVDQELKELDDTEQSFQRSFLQRHH